MRAAWVLVAAAGAVLVARGPAAAGEGGIAVVDVRQVMAVYPAATNAEAALRRQIEDLETEQEKLLADRDDAREALQKAIEETESKALSDKGREEKKREAEQKQADLRKLEIKIRDTLRLRQKQIADEERRARERIASELGRIVEQCVAGKGYSVVLDSSAVGLGGMRTVMYSEPSRDITSEVLRRIAEDGKKTAGAPSGEGKTGK
jgi:Skp family chaperone for outer membrane proteins